MSQQSMLSLVCEGVEKKKRKEPHDQFTSRDKEKKSRYKENSTWNTCEDSDISYPQQGHSHHHWSMQARHKKYDILVDVLCSSKK